MAYDQHSQYQPPQRDYYNQRGPPGQAHDGGYGQSPGYNSGYEPARTPSNSQGPRINGGVSRKPAPQHDWHGGANGGGQGVGYADGGHDDYLGHENGSSISQGTDPTPSARSAWDNPFPPVQQNKSSELTRSDSDRDLNQSMNRLNVSGNGYGQPPASDRPVGASRSNSNHSSNRGYGDTSYRGHDNQQAYGHSYSSHEGPGQQYGQRKNGLHADRFQEPQTAPVSPAARSFQEEPQRSMTMPNDVSGYNGPSGPGKRHDGGNFDPQNGYGRSNSDQQAQSYNYGSGQDYHAPQPHKEDPNFDVLDSYYGGSNEPYINGSNRPSPAGEMPDFDRQQRKGGPAGGQIGGQGDANYFGAQAHRSKSQPDLRRQNSREGANAVEMPGDVPPVPPAHRDRNSPGADPYGQGQGNRRMPGPARGGYGGPPPRGRGFNGPPPRGGPNMRGPPPGSRGGRPYPPGPPRGHGPPGPYRGQPRGGRGGPLGGPPGRGQDNRDPNARGQPPREGGSNPDALPHHPAPVRAGLLKDSPVNNPPPEKRPPPNSRGSTGSQGSQGSQGKRLSAPPVTMAELEQLNQAVRTSPGDRKTQLTLAKKWVEAASVLADEGGRADPRTRQRNRDKYFFDASKLVKKLVQSGYPAAMFYLADSYGQGAMGLEIDHREAFKLYSSAAKAGHSASAYRTAVCYEMGQEDGGGTTKDALKAVEWYRRGAALGDTPAMYKMGMIQLKGLLGQPRNPRDAVNWLKRAAEKADDENPHALHELGLLYQNASPNDSIIRDEAYARQLFFEAAELGYKFSQFRLGAAHEFGTMGCPVDPRTSIAWYSRSAVQEEHQSELALSGWYLTGAEGIIQQSDTEAYLWARKAAQAGLAKAEYAMGYFTEVGIGCPSNLEEAKRWYQRAAGQNFPKARERLDELRRGGAKVQKSRERLSRSKHTENDCSIM
ncbi:MAG: hypothetical protein M1814_002252 [Vezdaea aestivalis]|nr:MAG: hypothetical protein M1814_002252 [Vezdaea aestivalis]